MAPSGSNSPPPRPGIALGARRLPECGDRVDLAHDPAQARISLRLEGPEIRVHREDVLRAVEPHRLVDAMMGPGEQAGWQDIRCAALRSEVALEVRRTHGAAALVEQVRLPRRRHGFGRAAAQRQHCEAEEEQVPIPSHGGSPECVTPGALHLPANLCRGRPFQIDAVSRRRVDAFCHISRVHSRGNSPLYAGRRAPRHATERHGPCTGNVRRPLAAPVVRPQRRITT
jgi:hypothetical protein